MRLKILASFLCALTGVSGAAFSEDVPDWKKAEATEVWSPVPPVVDAPEGAPPSDAVVLFAGGDLSAWRSSGGDAAKWRVTDGAMTVVPGTGDIETRESFCDVQLHIEWMTPVETTRNGKALTGQGRGNSGVYLQGRYEVQILDSYKSETYPNGQAGAIYKQSIPLVNASRAPGQWQTYDIFYRAPRFDNSGRLVTPARMTVLHNGVLIQESFDLKGPTAWIGHPPYQPHGCAPLRLQDHGNPLSFRNIWLRRL